MSDALTTNSRNFFERTKLKMATSIVLGAGALLFLGFCSSAGGQSASASQATETFILTTLVNDDHQEASFVSLAAGYGFACFMYIIGFFLLVSAAIIASPIFVGSPKERKMLSSPEEIDSSYAAYTDSTTGLSHTSTTSSTAGVPPPTFVAGTVVSSSGGPTASSGVNVV